jgi:hypothetical protein
MRKQLFEKSRFTLNLFSVLFIFLLTESNIYGQCSVPPVYTSVGGNSAVLCEGGSMTPFTLNFNGATSFQWQRTPLTGSENFTNVPGLTSNTLSLSNVTKADEGRYRLVATNACGSTNSTNTFQLQVRLKPVITTNPVASKSVCQGSTLSLSVGIGGNAGSITWFKDDVPISGQQSVNLSVSNFQASNVGNYHAVIQPVTQCAGFTATSSKSSVSLATNIAFDTQPPASQNICVGSNLLLNPTISGTALSYQWRRSNQILFGETNSTLSINNINSLATGNYSVVITGTCNTLTSGNYSVDVSQKPTIGTNPTSVTKCAGENHTFTASAFGASRVEWVKDGSVILDGGNISGATTNSLTITNICSTCDAGTYALRAYGNGGCSTESVTTNTATLSVNEPINITSSTSSLSKCEGENVTLEVVATGAITGYQWKKAGTPITGQTSASLTLSNITTADAAEYSVDILGPCGNQTKSGIILTVSTTKATITTNPVNAIKCVGESQTFTAAASNAGSYKWQKDGSDLSDGGNISGSSSSSLTIANLCATCDAGTYTVKAFGTGACATQSVTSSSATLTVNTPISITSVSTSQSKCEGENVTLEVVASGTITGYQWKKAGNNITGQTNASLTLSNLTTADIAEYSVDIFGPCGMVSHSGINVAVALKPVFSLNPVNAIKCVGESQTFTAAASNAGSYKWQKDGSDLSDGGNISGSSSSSLTISNLCATCDAGTYTVKAFGAGACASQSVTSSAATLTVNTPISITSVSTSQSKCEGENVTLEVVAAGTITGYQWKRAGNNITGQTNASLTLSNLTTADIAEYSVDIFGPCGTVSHSGINVAVALKPVFSLNPVNAIKCVGESQTFTAAASNAGSYKWQKDGSDLSDGGNISGSSSSSLTISNLCATCDAGTYTLKAFGAGACASQSVTSSAATLTVNTPISITSVSSSQSKCEGENVTLEVVAAGTITGYQWKKAGNNITGQTNASLTLSNLTTADIAEYSVDIFGPCGTVSHSGINVAVALKPVFSLNPVNAIKCVGESQTFTAAASNAGSYKWQKDGSDLSDGGNITGSSSSSLTITNLCASCDAGTYTVKAFGTGACASQSVTSSAATLTVNTPISITSVSSSQSKCEGENVTLEVVAAGTITGYQWKKAGNNITGQTNASLTISDLTTADIADYSVDIFGPCGTVTHSGINVAVALKPVFSLNPVNAIKCVGQSQTFTAAAGNAGSYKWQKDGSDLSDGGNISGSSSSSLTISNLCATCDAGTYTVKAFGTGACASQSVISSSATLTVNTPISITTVSTSQSKCEGENVTLEVVAAGTITGYQWKKAGNNITGQTNASLTLSNLTTADIAEYSVDIFGPCGTVSHSGINVAVALKPVFSLNPVNATKCVGESQTFTATASNAGSYKWQKDGSDLSDGGNISGSSSSSLTITSLCATCDAGTYTVKAFGTGACVSQSVTSSAATLTVNTPITITSVSTSQSKCEGENVTLEVVASGTITGYQWKKAGNNITGQTNASLTLSNLTTADIAEYSVDIFGPCGTVSHSGINVAVALKPVFSLNPVNAIKCVGESQTFTAAASNAGSYKWQKDGSDLSDGGNISGSSSSSLTISNLCATCDAGTYTVKAFGTGACASQSVTSSSASLTVNTPISITSVSTSQSKCEGENVTLEVVAAGTITGYQWKRAGNNITGQTNASLTLSNLTTADIAEYSVDIFGPCGTVSHSGINVAVALKPVFSLNPENAIKCVGESQIFTATASNAGSYKWQKDGSDLSDGGNISGSSSSSLTIVNLCATCDAGTYTVKAFGTGACASQSVTSSAASLTVNTPISITSVSTSQSKCEGENVTLEIVAAGTITGYQWKKAGNNITGQTNASLTLNNLTTADIAEYSVDIFGPCGTVSHSGINVAVALKPVFSLNPVNTPKCVGETAIFKAAASNASSIFWQKDGINLEDGGNISGSNSATLIVSNIRAGFDTGIYKAIANGSGACSFATSISAEAILSINAPITNVKISPNADKCEGSSAIIEATHDGVVTGYQWFKNGEKIPNSTNFKIEFNTLKPSDKGTYTVEIYGPCGTITSTASFLNVTALPVIITQPIDAKRCIGESVTFQVAGTDFGSFRWFKNGANLNITTQNLNIPSVNELSSGQYIVDVFGVGACATRTTSSRFTNLEVGSKIVVEKITKNVSCFSLSDGSIQLKTTGGFGSPYSITWQNPSSAKGETATNLAAGLYEFTIADSRGCSQKDSIRISQPEKLSANLVSKTLNYCETSGKASVKTAAFGGTKPYKVSWSDLPNFVELDRQNLKAGTYTLKIVDANNCETTLATTIEDSTSKMSAKLSYTQPSCFGKADAKLSVLATSGRGAYKYTWTGVNYTGTASEITNLAVNNENAQAIATDALGCEVKSDILKLISPVAISINITKQKEVCPSKPFEVNGTVADGNKYEWTTPLGKKLLGAIIVGDSIGNYKLAVTNSLGCVALDSVSIIPNANVKPFFASPTQAPVSKEVVFVDLTNPLASNVKWIYPSAAKMISEDPTRLKLSFATLGTYKITSQVTVSDCIYTFAKNINIVDKVDDGGFAPPFGYDILDFTMLSNPITNGLIGIKLDEDHPKNFTISLLSVNGTQKIFTKKLENYNDNTVFFEIPANLNPNTSYILTLENEVSKKSKRVVILN